MSAFPQQLDEHSRRQVALWLTLCCGMIFAMVVLGGLTRLTDSGLSMVEWDPIFGAIPPLSDADWEDVFAKYRESPEYLKVNLGMDLHGFKSIYWYEYSHRVLGRSIGTVFLIPFLYFLWRRKLTPALVPKLALAFVLGGLQGLLGWYMVKSGLVDRPDVSQYRLTAHLSLALVIYAYLLWILFSLTLKPGDNGSHPPRWGAFLILVMVAVTISSGGFVAGIKAGHAYNTFPLMGGQWLPPAGWMLEPGWRNLFENIATVQFVHRVLAVSTFATILYFWLRQGRREQLARSTRLAVHLLMLMAIIQVTLGISTLLLQVPVPLAATHQAGALLLLTAALLLNYRLGNRQA